ncbi:toll/interleukin-1 receptor domain-containing protein [Pseudactinotalea sp. HY158]|uniref:toll/interleukin-1 receptor domain-containing protein n=1 Tax=Pseudactinotalea sp. HY158 TaxID=2654547 RepID=UPI00189215E7|nr:toll/interleukin-1 receptor domain-containing protein [Pseudactinotalea sp. HY158]
MVVGTPPAELSPRATAEFALDATPIWRNGMVRMFLSHSAKHKKFASKVAQALAPMGIDGFVAHDSMSFDHDWQDQIQVGLKTMDVFVVLLHKEVNESAWCQQEIGWAQGASTPIYLVRLGADPAGFVGRKQYPQVFPEDAEQVATKLFQWLSAKEEFAQALIDGQLSALDASRSYIESISITKGLVQVASLSEAQWQRLDSAVLNNGQVGGSGGARRNLEPFYVEHRREWPLVVKKSIL